MKNASSSSQNNNDLKSQPSPSQNDPKAKEKKIQTQPENDAANLHENPNDQINKKNQEMDDLTEAAAWSEEFKILYNYDANVKKCHDELEKIDAELSKEFREQVTPDRKKATRIKNKLKKEYEKKLSPYETDALNKGLAQARNIGLDAEEEFIKVVKVMGEDIDVSDTLTKIKRKFLFGQNIPATGDGALKYWEIVRRGDVFYLKGDKGYKSEKEAIDRKIEYLSQYLRALSEGEIVHILTANGYTLTQKSKDNLGKKETIYRVGNKDKKTTIDITKEELIRFIVDNISPEMIKIFRDKGISIAND